ncbi:MAG TPA: SEC-C metal-binding domain-containing protein [Dongiaceae bacterium]|nr:SEC-C metal-binding domain-containing protein [Dongiaceae bacterium]
MLGLKELRPLVVKAFERGSISRRVTELKYFDEDLAKSLAQPDDSSWLSDEEFTLFGDTVEELSTWYGFSEEYYRKRERSEEEWDEEDVDPALRFDEFMPATPVTNPPRHIGRNDPCPCGSGKKYKKCCLA